MEEIQEQEVEEVQEIRSPRKMNDNKFTIKNNSGNRKT